MFQNVITDTEIIMPKLNSFTFVIYYVISFFKVWTNATIYVVLCALIYLLPAVKVCKISFIKLFMYWFVKFLYIEFLRFIYLHHFGYKIKCQLIKSHTIMIMNKPSILLNFQKYHITEPIYHSSLFFRSLLWIRKEKKINGTWRSNIFNFWGRKINELLMTLV